MLKWFRKRRIDGLVAAVEQYISENQSVDVKPKKPAKDAQEGDKPRVQYSYRDTYDPNETHKAMDEAYKMMKGIVVGRDYAGAMAMLESRINMSFVDKLLEHMRKRELSSVDVYKRAQLDRRLFSKIMRAARHVCARRLICSPELCYTANTKEYKM